MRITQVDRAFINDFDFYLRSEKNASNNYAVKNLKNLGKIIHICLANGWISSNPFLGYKGKSRNVERHFINQDELQRLANRKFISERLDQVRDVFLFCCFTGLAYTDVFQLKTEHLQKGNDGE